ncbi:hypothetical protein FI667_g4473, partial [Globisporangium splendens]
MEALPGTLVAEILAFACAPALVPATPGGAACFSGGGDACDFAKRVTAPSTHALRSLASVCSTWRDAVAAIVADHKQLVFTLAFTVGDEERAQTQYEAHLKQHGERIRDLRVTITTPTQSLWWVLDEEEEVQQQASTLYGQWIEWERLLVHVPMLERLDLSGVPLHHFSVREILEIASLHCPHVQALVLPRKERVHADALHATIDETCRVLYVALARWYNASGSRGLCQLTVPNRDEYDRDHNSARFLDAVTSFCPKIEYLDGWKRTYNDVRFVVSDESWYAPRHSNDDATDVWTRFCATCVHLREFSWVVVPFADAYFMPFGNAPKPLLTHLQLTYNAKAPFRIRRSEYSTSGLCHVLQACPKLQVLDVILHRIQPSHAFVYLQLDEMIDPDVFNDEFLATLTASCPLVESVRIREVKGDRGSSVMTTSSITDTGLQALAALKQLRAVDLQGASCSAAGILSLINGCFCAGSKTIKLRELGTRFGDIVTELLQYITFDTEGDWSGGDGNVLQMPLCVSLSSRRGSVFKRSILEDANAAMKKRHPHLRFVAVYAEKLRLSASSSKKEKDEFLREQIDRTWLKREVVRIGRIVLYSHAELLSERMQQQLAEQSESCILKL